MSFRNGCIIMCQTSTKYHKIIDVDGLKCRTKNQRESTAPFTLDFCKFIGSNNSMVSLPLFHALAFQGQSTGGTIGDVTPQNTAVREPRKEEIVGGNSSHLNGLSLLSGESPPTGISTTGVRS